MITASRYHDISCGHRVVGHEGKCANLHGHNYRITFVIEAEQLDSIGRVLDFSVIKSLLCQWLEENWDHKLILWSQDPAVETLRQVDPTIVVVGFNPTAENLGQHLLNVVAPMQLVGTGAKLVEVVVEETRKCSATVRLG